MLRFSRFISIVRCALIAIAACGAMRGQVLEEADWILSARRVVTMDGARRVVENGAVAVRGSTITAVGTRAEIEKRFKAKQTLDAGDAILAPGLINTHTHAPMALFRGIADDLKLQDWLEKFIFPAEAKAVDPEFVRWGTRLACAEMLLSGTTTYVDMYYFEELIAEETKACGMRGVLGQTLIGFPVPDAKTVADGLRRTEAFLKRFRNDELITPAVAPHAVYTNSDETLRAARELADRYAAPLIIHVAETRKEVDDLRAKRTLSPVQVLDSLGVLRGRTLIAHGVHNDASDIRILKDRGTGVAHCPSSNMMLSSGVAPLTEYLAADVAVGLGTDGPAGSNNDLNMFEEMDLAAKLQKVHRNDPTAVRAVQMFEMATARGARALAMQDRIGSIEAGKLADLIVVSTAVAHAAPMYDVYSHIVYAAKGSDVRHVMVNGRMVVRDRKVLTLDEAQVLSKAAEYGRKVAKIVGR